jgi:signal transduction histidine kinase
MPETMINEVLYIAKDKISKSIHVKVTCKDGQPVYCDSEYMRLCIMNLLMNAIQAIENKGEITFNCGKDNGFSYISVSDTGAGIGEEDKDKVFEPYYSTKKFGIGLGLAISKRFIEEHGGTIIVESEVGKGTTMQLRIPDNEA